MQAGIRDILIISTPQDTSRFESLLGDGSDYGIKLTYRIQEHPDGLAQAFIIGEDFIDGDSCALVLGDNIFYGEGFETLLKKAIDNCEKGNATVFGYRVKDPQRFGVVEFDNAGKVISIEEKPENPKSNYAVTGLYFYDNRVVKMSKKIKPSDRGELEITDINKLYLKEGKLKVSTLSSDYVWMDAGTFVSMFEATEFIKQNFTNDNPIGVPEVIAYCNGWIDKNKIKSKYDQCHKSPYSKYLKKLLE